MAYEIETYDPSANDGTGGVGDGYGRPNFPPNYDSGAKMEAVGYGAPMAWKPDLIADQGDKARTNDPAIGFDNATPKVSSD